MENLSKNEKTISQSENDIQEYYLYPKRYLSRSEKKILTLNNIKGKILEFISGRKKLAKWLDIWETYTLDNDPWIKKHNICSIDLFKHVNFYKDICLKDISFFEAIEIDNFNDFRKKAISKFGNYTDFLGTNKKNELQEKLSDLENNFDSIQWGNLFSINFKKSRKPENDLINSIHCRFIKTNESYFIISFDLSLSDKSIETFKRIIQQSDVSLSFPSYNSIVNIIRKKRFYYQESFKSSLKTFNVQNFISDISTQIKKNVTRYFKGYFHNSKIFKNLPNIQLFEVENIKEFNTNNNFKSIYSSEFGKYYTLEDEQIEIHFSESFDKEQEVIYIIKQKGHGKRDTNSSDLTDWDNIENNHLIRGLSFPCVFSGILKEQTFKLNTLKRQIYDQIKLSGNRFIIKHFFLLGLTRKYLKLKHKSLQILLTMKRFENEFSDNIIQYYTKSFDLQSFKARNISEKEEKTLLAYFIKSFHYQMNKLNSKTKSLNEVFKSLEEFNSYKTNFILQLFSILIGILALIFTFDKTKSFIINIIYKFLD